MNCEKQLNILYHHRTQGRGAEGVHIQSIVSALETLGHKVTVVSPPGINPLKDAGNAPVDKSKVKTTGVKSIWKVISNHLPNLLFEIVEIFYNIPALVNLEKELSGQKFDLIYERYAFFMIAGAIKAKKYGIPLVLEANEVSGIKDRARKQTFVRLCSWFEKYLFKRCTSIHTVSSFLKSRIIEQQIPPCKIVVSPNAIDPLKFTGNKSYGSLKKELKIDENNTVIGFAGWFDDWDRLDLLVETFNTLLQSQPNTTLLLIGDGAVLQQVSERSNELGIAKKIIMTGAVERSLIHQYLSLLDIAVFTHSNEFGSPVVMFEFMGLKIPVVAPRLMPITDVLKHNETALLFETLNMNEMQSQLITLINDKDRQALLAKNAYEQLMHKHTWKSNAEEIIQSAGI